MILFLDEAIQWVIGSISRIPTPTALRRPRQFYGPDTWSDDLITGIKRNSPKPL